MLITNKLGIQADSGALWPYLGIKVTWSLNVDKKLSWLNFVHIIYFESLRTFHQQEYNIPVQYCNTHCNITL